MTCLKLGYNGNFVHPNPKQHNMHWRSLWRGSGPGARETDLFRIRGVNGVVTLLTASKGPTPYLFRSNPHLSNCILGDTVSKLGHITVANGYCLSLTFLQHLEVPYPSHQLSQRNAQLVREHVCLVSVQREILGRPITCTVVS